MSDFDAGGAPAPSEGPSAPITNTGPADTPPLGTQTPVAEKPPVEKPEAPKDPKPKEEPSKTAGDAIRRATEKIKEQESGKAKEPVSAPEKQPAKEPEPKTEQRERGDGGRFAPKEPSQASKEPAGGDQQASAPQQPQKASAPHDTAPTRMSPDAQREWANAPESVRAETHRAITELTRGIDHYKTQAEPLRQYAEAAERNGTSLPDVLGKYSQLEHGLRGDHSQKMEAIKEVFDFAGIPIHEFASAILGQTPDENASQQDQTIRALKDEISELKRGVGSITQSFEQQRTSAVEADVSKFAQDNPRFEEIAEDIAFFLKSDKIPRELPHAERLSQAYALAERLNPGPAAQTTPSAAQPASTPQLNPAGQKSISGAPSPGSNPTRTQQPASSTREALERAMKRVGRS